MGNAEDGFQNNLDEADRGPGHDGEGARDEVPQQGRAKKAEGSEHDDEGDQGIEEDAEEGPRGGEEVEVLDNERHADEAGTEGNGNEIDEAACGFEEFTSCSPLKKKMGGLCIKVVAEGGGSGQAEKENGPDDAVGKLETEVEKLGRLPEEDEPGREGESRKGVGLAGKGAGEAEATDHDPGADGGGAGPGEPDVDPGSGEDGKDGEGPGEAGKGEDPEKAEGEAADVETADGEEVIGPGFTVEPDALIGEEGPLPQKHAREDIAGIPGLAGAAAENSRARLVKLLPEALKERR